ncbi:2Fe-2S iron-sulfur cluster-binding protein [Escherichia coli]
MQSDGQKVTVRQDGRIGKSCLMPTIKAFSMRHCARRRLPYACKGGVCATGNSKVLRGKVAMETNYSLEPDELAAGYV